MWPFSLLASICFSTCFPFSLLWHGFPVLKKPPPQCRPCNIHNDLKRSPPSAVKCGGSLFPLSSLHIFQCEPLKRLSYLFALPRHLDYQFLKNMTYLQYLILSQCSSHFSDMYRSTLNGLVLEFTAQSCWFVANASISQYSYAQNQLVSSEKVSVAFQSTLSSSLVPVKINNLTVPVWMQLNFSFSSFRSLHVCTGRKNVGWH